MIILWQAVTRKPDNYSSQYTSELSCELRKIGDTKLFFLNQQAFFKILAENEDREPDKSNSLHTTKMTSTGNILNSYYSNQSQ